MKHKGEMEQSLIARTHCDLPGSREEQRNAGRLWVTRGLRTVFHPDLPPTFENAQGRKVTI